MNIQPTKTYSSATVFSGIRFRRPRITNNPLINKSIAAETSKKGKLLKDFASKIKSKVLEWTKKFIDFFEGKNTYMNEFSQNIDEISKAKQDVFSCIA